MNLVGVDQGALRRALAWADEREDDEARFREENGEQGGIWTVEDRRAAREIRAALAAETTEAIR